MGGGADRAPADTVSDYAYLREHFREKHFLCEEGRCSTEQFTHAFRTEIDLKAHKTACHSRSRAEARQNRQIDLQFSYTPRHSRRNEGEQGLPSAKQGSQGRVHIFLLWRLQTQSCFSLSRVSGDKGFQLSLLL